MPQTGTEELINDQINLDATTTDETQSDENNDNTNIDPFGEYLWEGQNIENNKVSSGIYIYITEDKYGNIKKGKMSAAYWADKVKW